MARSVRHGGSFLLCYREVTAARAFAAGRRSLLLFGLMGLLALRGVASSTAHPVAPQSPFDRAQRARQALESRPEDERTKRDYDRVLDLYRAIYHDNPASPKADASIFAVAELLAEEGRLLHDEKSLNDAIGQYEFLRREYPASHYRSDALLAEGNIYLRDLDDRANAKATLQSFLKQYPHSPQTAEVRKDLKEIHTGQIAAATNAAPPQVPTAADISRPSSSGARPKHSNTGLTTAIQSQSVEPPPQTSQAATMPSSAPAAATPQKSRIGASTPPVLAPQVVPQPATSPPTTTPPAIVATDISPRQNPTPATLTQVPHRKGRLVQVTGVRHWSTSVYTRVAIDLGDEVQYEAARVPDPDRIFFDLHGARLSPELIGRSIDVTDDGFLKRIRAAQFSNDVTRIVLDVSDVSDYSAFLLPNPYRLIIDIHGRKPGVLNTQQLAQSVPPVAAPSVIQQNPAPRNPAPVASAATSSAKSPAASGSNPSAIVTNRAAPAPPPAKPQPATVVVTTSTASPGDKTSAQDIASLGRQPDRVQATNHPTTAPIAASVAGTTPAQQPDLAKPPPTHNAKRTKATDNSQTSAVTAASVHEADPTAEGGRSMVRALGLKIGRIVVDAGHGGHDSGTLGPDGIQEKDVVLDVSLRLGKLLKQRLGADVIFTRGDDTFIPLETRTAIANKAQADLFVSVHANSSPDPSARGVETYYLNFTSSPESLELAARENAVSQQSIHQLSDLVKKIALHDKIDESREFASDVERYLYEGLDQGNPGLKDRGVKQAPFVVLIGANMPSILAEISFLTNADDAHQLRDPDYRQRIAESLYRGVARYVSGLSGVRLAENSSQLP